MITIHSLQINEVERGVILFIGINFETDVINLIRTTYLCMNQIVALPTLMQSLNYPFDYFYIIDRHTTLLLTINDLIMTANNINKFIELFPF